MAPDSLKIVEFQPCQECGECCQTPCDLVPSDLKPLLERFGLDLRSFFRRYLIALPIASPDSVDEILMMVPVRVYDGQKRSPKYLADNEYLNTPGECIFLDGSECSIYDIRPFGARFLKCAKMTGSVSFELQKSQCFPYWRGHQHLFEIVLPGFADTFDRLETIFERMSVSRKDGNEYKRLAQERERIIREELFPLFNGRPPVDGYQVLVND